MRVSAIHIALTASNKIKQNLKIEKTVFIRGILAQNVK